MSKDNPPENTTRLSLSSISLGDDKDKPKTSPLDSLLSPQPTATFKNDHDSPARDSVASASSSFNEVALDEGEGDETMRFSTVPLSSTRGSVSSVSSNVGMKSARSSLDADQSPDARRRTISIPKQSDLAAHVAKTTGHKKSASNASNSTAASGGNVPFMLQRLDLQKVQAQDGIRSQQRSSIDGHQKIQEEFARVQQEHTLNGHVDEGEHPETPQNGASGVDWDFWGTVISDYQNFASENAERLAQEIALGIPDNIRGMMWQLMSASRDPELEATYIRLLKETSPHEKAITRDLGRTFPHHDYFTDGQGVGQENLFNVLKAYSLYDTQVGYCQGLPFIVAILLLNMPDEMAFCLLVRLMYSYDLRGHFLPEMPKLQLRLFQFDRLIEELLPVLSVHFLRQGVKSSMFCSQWFLTMFSYRFPLNIVFRIYDNCLASGIEAIFGFSIALLVKNEETLLKLKFDEILNFMKTRVFEVYQINPEEAVNEDTNEPNKNASYRTDEFVRDAVSLKITPFMLDAYAHEYEDLVRKRDAHQAEVDGLRNTVRTLSAQVEELQKSLQTLDAEHVEVLNELVKARLQHEEMESELVRYKLLYAEAMHQNADALSSNRLSANLLGGKRGSDSSSKSTSRS